jgi:pimeloyl-ACP methyl ester carboxylesterase
MTEPAIGRITAAAISAAAIDEVETSSFAAAGLDIQTVPFEKTRSLEIYLPMLRASYDFAHGNPDPALPATLERLAKVEAGIDPVAAVAALTPQEQAAVDNDMRALDEEAARSIVAAAIANPGGFGFVARVKNTDEFLVSIRGTQTPEEWVKNFTAVPNPWNEVPGFGVVHLGFEQMWRRIRVSVFDALRNVPARSRITMVGHSLGGAMATLGAADLKRNLGKDVDVDLWTVGCPRVGQLRFRSNFNRLVPQSFRVVNQGDIVPHLPSVLQLFAHVGKEVDVKGHNGNAHSLDAYQDGIRQLADEGITAVAAAAGAVMVPAAATL